MYVCMYTPVGSMVIYNLKNYKILLDHDLVKLFGVDRRLQLINFLKKFTSPTAYNIHCDLVDKEKNLSNGQQSHVLA